MKKSANLLPPLEEAYLDQFGTIETDVYEVAQQIWPRAERLALDLLGDGHLGVELMLRAAARVSAIKKTGVEILNPRFYLLRTFKNLVLAEFDKEKSRNQILSNNYNPESQNTDDENVLYRKILIEEVRSQMDQWTKEVFDHLVLGYSFEELAPKYGSGSNVIRSKYHKKMQRLSLFFVRRMRNE